MNPMGVMTNFPQGFANGIAIRGMPLLQMQPGVVYWLDNGPVLNPQQRAGSDGNRGTYLDPFATLNYAVNTACQPGRGDVIMVGAGHQETISSATIAALSCSGVAVVGVGAGALRPTFTFNTAATANIPVYGAGISIQNCLFIGNFLSIASVFTGFSTTFTGVISGNVLTASAVTGTITPGATLAGTGVTPATVINAQLTGTVVGGAGTYSVTGTTSAASATMTTSPTDFAIDMCEFRDTSSVLGFLTIWTPSATANAADGFSMTRCVWNSLSTVSVTCAIVDTVSQDRWNISDNFMVSPITTGTQGPILLATGSGNMTSINIARNTTFRPNTSSSIPCAVSTSGTGWTGQAYLNNFHAMPTGTGIWISTGSGLGLTQNFSRLTNTADKSNTLNPVAV